jgi:hypothetical protein
MNRGIRKHFWFFLIVFFVFFDRAEGKLLHLESLGISIPILESYEIVPQHHWRDELKFGQQFGGRVGPRQVLGMM